MQTEIGLARQKLSEFRELVDKLNGKRRPFVQWFPCPYCKTQHSRKAGTYRSLAEDRISRFRCLNCRRTFSTPAFQFWYRTVDLSHTKLKTRERIKFAVDLFIQGVSIREVERRAKVARHTSLMVRKRVGEAQLLPTFCLCGAKAGHRGWCKDRFQRSARRQAALAAIHARQRKG